jgi:hypothetical protein
LKPGISRIRSRSANHSSPAFDISVVNKLQISGVCYYYYYYYYYSVDVAVASLNAALRDAMEQAIVRDYNR